MVRSRSSDEIDLDLQLMTDSLFRKQTTVVDVLVYGNQERKPE